MEDLPVCVVTFPNGDWCSNSTCRRKARLWALLHAHCFHVIESTIFPGMELRCRVLGCTLAHNLSVYGILGYARAHAALGSLGQLGQTRPSHT